MKQNIIGKHASITNAPNKELIGIEGVITNETKNTIEIKGKTIIKNNITITIEGKQTNITNKLPSERIIPKRA